MLRILLVGGQRWKSSIAGQIFNSGPKWLLGRGLWNGFFHGFEIAAPRENALPFF